MARPEPRAVDLFTWRNAVMSDNGPPNPLTRLVLMAISLHMKPDGTGAWPSQETIATRAGVGERSARRHLEAAQRDAWLERCKVRRDKGRNWYFHEYAAAVPADVYDRLPERPWEADPTWRRRPATVAARQADDRPETTTTGQPRHDDRPLVHDDRSETTVTTGHSGRLTLPLNSSKNSSEEGALARTGRPKAVSPEDARDRIRNLVADPKRREQYRTPEDFVRLVPPSWRFAGYEAFVQEVWRDTGEQAA